MAPANVEATVLVLDVGRSASCRERGALSCLEHARACAARIAERKIFSRPDDLLALVVLGSAESVNELDLPHVSIGTPMAQVSWKFIRILTNKVKSTECEGSWFDGLKVAADFLGSELQQVKVSCKKIVLMAQLGEPPQLGPEELQQLIDQFNKEKFELIFIGPEICLNADQDSSESKPQQQSENLLMNIIAETDGIACSFRDAETELEFYKRKHTTPRPWNVQLSLGSKISIPVAAYPKIRKTGQGAPWRRARRKPGSDAPALTLKEYRDTDAVIKCRKFFKKDDKTVEVDADRIIFGYLYGSTLVPFTEPDSVMRYRSGAPGLKLFGFTRRERLRLPQLTGDGTTFITGRRGNEDARGAIETLAVAMERLGLVGLARRVYSQNTAPRMQALFPILEKDFCCLAMVALIFAEDSNDAEFPPFETKFEATDEQVAAVDSLIAAMDLSCLGEDEKELISTYRLVDPAQQHLHDCIAHRALHPGKVLAPPRPRLARVLEPPCACADAAAAPLRAIGNLFQLTVKEKIKSKKYWVDKNLAEEKEKEDPDAPLRHVPSDPLVSAVTEIGSADPEGDFLVLLERGDVPATVCAAMRDVLQRLVLLLPGADLAKPLGGLRALRECCVFNGLPLYNTWLREFKMILLDRFKVSFFRAVLQHDLGLISKLESEVCGASTEEVKKFSDIVSEDSISDPQMMDTTDIDNLFDE